MGKRTIKISSSDLEHIIKETIENVLENDINSDDCPIDVRKIPISILRQSYVDLRLIPSQTAFGDILSGVPSINEAYGDIMPPDEVVENIIRKYHLNPSTIHKQEGYNKIYVYVLSACIGVNDKLIEEDMEKMGYFLGARKPPVTVCGMTFQVLQFEPYSQNQTDETDNLKKQYRLFYHWTPAYYAEDILKKGLLPRHENKMFNFPNRIYLMKGNCTMPEILSLGSSLSLVNSEPRNTGKYVLLQVRVDNLDKGVRLYYDPNSPISLYTESPIPPEHIRYVGTFDFPTTAQ